MAPGGCGLSAGQDKAPQGRQRAIEPVDGLLQAGSLLGLYAEAGAGRFVERLRHTEIGSDIKEIVLDTAQQLCLIALRVTGKEKAEGSVQLIDAAVSGDARVVLGHAGPVAKPRVAPV